MSVHSAPSVHSHHSVHSDHSVESVIVPPASPRAPSIHSLHEGHSNFSLDSISIPSLQSSPNAVEQLLAKISLVVSEAWTGIKECFDAFLVWIGLNEAPVSQMQHITLSQLMIALPQLATPFAKLLMIQKMYACPAEEGREAILAQAMNFLPESARNLIYWGNWVCHHENADWIDAPDAGQTHFLANIGSAGAADAVTVALQSLPAYAIQKTRDFIAEDRSNLELLQSVAFLQNFEIPEEAWRLEVDTTTREEINETIRLVIGEMANGVEIEGVSFNQIADVSDEEHKVAINAAIARLQEAVLSADMEDEASVDTSTL
jgi:hypothetical protein